MTKPKVLYFDIEILPKHYETRFGADRSSICCFGYKFDTDKKAKCLSLLDFPEHFAKDAYIEAPLIKEAYKIMNEADVIIGHYSEKFDFPYMVSKFVQLGLDVTKIVHAASKNDTWRLAKRHLKMSSNRLDSIARFFGLESKLPTEVMWWFRTIQGHAPSLKKLAVYCAQDVEVLHNVHTRLRGFEKISKRSNSNFKACPHCNSKTHIHGRYATIAGTEKVVLKCTSEDCGRACSISKTKFEGKENEV
jgi:DNA polymerase elongation subunit (family B)